MTRLRALVVADDLTGATDTGNEFAARGHATLVALDLDTAPGDASVFVANTESRYADATDAQDRVATVVGGHDAEVCYKKVDSTLRGNVVAEVDAAVRTADADLALVAPAFPRNGRLTADGYHLVDGELVTDTAAGQDPDKPVPDPHLPTMFGESAYPVEHVSVGQVARGADAVADALVDVAAGGSGPSVVIGDAVHDSHLAALATGAAATDLDVVYVGSAGLARHVQLPDPAPDESPAETPNPDEGPRSPQILGISGSVNPTTLDQLGAVPDEQVVPLDIATAVQAPAEAAERAAERCVDTMAAHGSAVVTSARSQTDPEQALQIGREHGVSERIVRKHMADALAFTADAVWDRSSPDGLFLTGGAIAIAVLDRLDATGIALSGEEISAGVPLGRIAGGRADEIPVVTKAGGFGKRTTIATCLRRLGERQ